MLYCDAFFQSSPNPLIPLCHTPELTMKLNERSSWSVKDESIAEELAVLMNLDGSESETLSALESEAEGRARDMTEDFYDRLFSHENTKEYFEGHNMEHLHSMIGDWFVELFRGTYDSEYVENRLKIGYIHVKIGLPVRYPLAMIDIISQHGEAVAAQSDDPETAQKAFKKVLALDVAIFNQAYEDNQLKHLSELVGGERLARRLLMGMG